MNSVVLSESIAVLFTRHKLIFLAQITYTQLQLAKSPEAANTYTTVEYHAVLVMNSRVHVCISPLLSCPFPLSASVLVHVCICLVSLSVLLYMVVYNKHLYYQCLLVCAAGCQILHWIHLYKVHQRNAIFKMLFSLTYKYWGIAPCAHCLPLIILFCFGPCTCTTNYLENICVSWPIMWLCTCLVCKLPIHVHV